MQAITWINPLKINVLTKEQYDNATIAKNELYFVPPIEDDYVVEIGNESFWTYRKWNSGLAECWGTVTVTLTHYTTWGSGYGYYTEQNFPTNFFIEPPAISYSAKTVSSFAFTALSLGLTAQKANYYTLSSVSGQRAVTFYIIATGKWK